MRAAGRCPPLPVVRMDAGMIADPTTHARWLMFRRIYLPAGRLNVGAPGDGDRGREYRVRFLGHIIAGARAAA